MKPYKNRLPLNPPQISRITCLLCHEFLAFMPRLGNTNPSQLGWWFFYDPDLSRLLVIFLGCDCIIGVLFWILQYLINCVHQRANTTNVCILLSLYDCYFCFFRLVEHVSDIGCNIFDLLCLLPICTIVAFWFAQNPSVVL